MTRATIPRLALAALIAVALAGCRTSHYVVTERGAPLYRKAEGDDVLTWMPRHHHEALEDAPAEAEEGRRVALSYHGLRGYADRWDVLIFDYLDPALDQGVDRAVALGRALREVQLADMGSEWPSAHVADIRAGRVTTGMTRLEVEVAWGWPVTVESGRVPGTERWVYREATTITLPPEVGLHPHASRTIRVPVTAERIVEFDENGRVTRVRARAVLDDVSPS